MHGTHLSTVLVRCLFILMLFSTPVFAAGGACPSGANYPNAAGTNVTLASLGVTSCFYASSSGSDTNSGTTESSPWLHFPGMSGCYIELLDHSSGRRRLHRRRRQRVPFWKEQRLSLYFWGVELVMDGDEQRHDLCWG